MANEAVRRASLSRWEGVGSEGCATEEHKVWTLAAAVTKDYPKIVTIPLKGNCVLTLGRRPCVGFRRSKVWESSHVMVVVDGC